MVDKILVTGGSGFLGTKIINFLNKNNIEFINYDLLKPKEFSESFVHGDILDKNSLYKAMKECNSVIHCAASLPLNKNDKNYKKVNVEGTKNLVELANELNFKHFLYVSSSAVLGNKHTGLIKESAPRAPFDPYGKSKSLAEEVIESSLDKDIKLCIIRPRTIVGTNRIGIFGILYEFTKNNMPIFIIGNGTNMLQLIDGDEIAEAISKASINSITGIYNLGNNDTTTIKTLYKEFVKSINSKSKIIHLPKTFSIFLLTVLDKLRLSPLAPWHYKSFHVDFAFESSDLYKQINYVPIKNNLKILKDNYKDVQNFSNDDLNVSTHQSKTPLKLLNIFKLFSKK